MSAEPENEPTSTSSDPDPVEIEPQPEPEPGETEDPPPPPGDTMGTVVTVEPATWYEVTSVCSTETCPNLNTSTTEPMVYSNEGSLRMVCGRCGFNRPITAFSKLDPQPEMS